MSPDTPAVTPDGPGDRLGVVMLLGWNGPGGTQRQALRLSAELRRLGVDATVLASRHGHLARHETLDGVELHRVGRSPAPRLAAVSFLCGALAWMIRRRHTFQLIHAHNLPMALTGALLGPLLRKPVIAKLPNAVTVETFGRRRLGTLRWLVLRRAVARFVALNREIEERLRARHVPAGRIVRIPNGVHAPGGAGGLDRVPGRGALGVSPDTRVVVYLGRLIPDKGLGWLLQAWRDVSRRTPGCRLLIVGDGPDGPRLRALAAELGIDGSVAFLGHQDGVEPLLGAADILVLPSRSEGMSNALLEGMAHALAVVASDVPGNRAVVEHERDGVLVPYGDHARLSAALDTLLRDAPLRQRLGREAARKIDATYAIGTVARSYRGIYRELVGGPAT